MIVRVYKTGDTYYAWNETIDKLDCEGLTKAETLEVAAKDATIIIVDSSFKKKKE